MSRGHACQGRCRHRRRHVRNVCNVRTPRHRGQTMGPHDLSHDSQVAWLINAATNHLVSGRVPASDWQHASLLLRPTRTFTASDEHLPWLPVPAVYAFCTGDRLNGTGKGPAFFQKQGPVVSRHSASGAYRNRDRATRRLPGNNDCWPWACHEVANIETVLTDPHTLARRAVNMPATTIVLPFAFSATR